MDTISEARLSFVVPALAVKVRQMSVILADEFTFRVTQGLRSWNEQAALYAQGRETLIQVNSMRKAVHWAPLTEFENIRVTNAAPGYSWHNFGMAVDVVPDNIDIPGFQPDWNEAHPSWARLIVVGRSVGLVNGISWHDEPHFQLTGCFPVTPDDEVRQLYAQAGSQAVWEEALAA